ncbi:restriction endonuclease subunit S [Enterococcus faecium]|nr:restriction endonuclease subunit S [Enterococcus faecium]
MSNDTQPEIRFPGFTEDWKQRKLIEVARYRNGKAHEQAIDESGKYIVVNSKFVSTNGRVKKYTNIIIDPLKKNELAFVLSDVPNGKAIARTFLVDKEHRYSLNQRIAGITPHKDTDSYFLNVLMNRNPYFLKFDNGVGQTNLTKADVENFIGHYPSYEEQQKIGTFFKQLDDTIALHQRKLDLLKETKKGFLQKMFPKNGAKVPEIRFPGFTDDWEQRTLGDILKEFSIKSKVENEYTVLSSTNSGMEIRNGRVSGVSNLGYKIIENGDLVLSPQNLWLGNININNVGTGLVSPSYKTFKFIKVDPGFIRPQLRTARMLEEYKNSSTQGASVVRRNLELGSFYQITIKIPSDVEQGKIGLFFKQLDNLIALHQRKLDLLKETKKGFLQKMFV